MEPIGLYIHVPFCVSKCPYCDFYSLAAQEDAMDAYTDAVIRSLEAWATYRSTSCWGWRGRRGRTCAAP